MRIINKIPIAIVLSELLCLVSLHAQPADYPIYTNSRIEHSADYLNGNIYQKDLLLFLDMLQTTHPAFCTAEKEPFNVDDVMRDGYHWAAKCNSKQNLYRYLQKIATKLNDGHTTLIPDMQSDKLYPFDFFIDGENIFLSTVDRRHADQLGKQIAQINGHPVWDVIDSFRSVLSCDNDNFFRANIHGLLQLHSMWEQNRYYRTDSILQLTMSSGKTIDLQGVAKESLNVESVQTIKPMQVAVPTKAPFSYTLLPDKKICYMFFNTCMDQNTIRAQYSMNYGGQIPEQIEQKLAQIPRFDEFLREMFARIEADEITTLVVDVRYNGGGNSRLCDLLISWLKPAADTKFYCSAIRTSALWEQNYPALAQQYKDAAIKANNRIEMGKLYNSEFFSSITAESSLTKHKHTVEQDDTTKTTFGGQVIFVQGSKTYSSAGMLITQAFDNNIGLVIGEPSTYCPTHYGDMLRWELPNTKIHGNISHKIFYRPDNSNNEQSLQPEVSLIPTWNDAITGKDIFQDWIMEHCK